eukprot:14758882-Alexandrium_andersonii.AAC.1
MSAEGSGRFVPMLSLRHDSWGQDRPLLEGVGELIDERCRHVDRDGHLLEIFAELAPPGENADPPLMPMPRQ